MQDAIHQSFSVSIAYSVFFTRQMLSPANPLLASVLRPAEPGEPARALVVLDAGVAKARPPILREFERYAHQHGIDLVAPPLIVPGGEAAKDDPACVHAILQAIDRFGICRHSHVVAVGGGAVLDMAGFAAATAHRGVRLVRVPTTVLAQNDAGIGVKNGVNAFGKKNFIGCFQAPHAVINDRDFLCTLGPRDWRAGLAEAVKIALIRDAHFFAQLERQAQALAEGDLDSMTAVIRRCAELHLDHISHGGDPFEHGSARPLDFGHWAAHRLEALTRWRLRHGEAVAIGIALDSLYSRATGLDAAGTDRILALLQVLGFALYVPELDEPSLFEGLAQFREHLGGELTLTLLRAIGQGVEVHAVDQARYREAVGVLRSRACLPHPRRALAGERV